MAIAREAEPVGSLQEVREAGLDREDLLAAYRNMLITRGIEERGHILYKQGKIPGSFYTGRGNEAASVGVATAMGPEDVGTPLHRDMGVHVTRGVEEEDEIAGGVKRLLNEALRRAEESPLPEPESLTEGVFATPEDLDTPH